MTGQRLLSDIEGKIKHILMASTDINDVRRVKSTIDSFDEDVEVTIAYQGNQDGIPNRRLARAKRFLRIDSHLEHIVAEIDGREVNFLPVENYVWPWIQDCLHVLEGKRVFASYPLNDLPYSQRQKAQRTSLELIASPFWEEHGFAASTNGEREHHTEGGDFIAMGETVFVGNQQMFNYLAYKMGFSPISGLSGKAYTKSKKILLDALKLLDSERTVYIVGAPGQILQHHVDMVFTPVDEPHVVVADIHQTLAYLDLPNEVKVAPFYKNLADQLEIIAEILAKNFDVHRIPCIPRLYVPRKANRQNKAEISEYDNSLDIVPTFLSFNNVLQEKFSENGNKRHRIYMPVYPVQAFPRIDPSKLTKIQSNAHNTYASLGCEVRDVLFDTFPAPDGVLRCTTLVLERG